MRRDSTARHAIVVGAMAVTVALAVPVVTSGTTDGRQPETHRAELTRPKNQAVTASAVDHAANAAAALAGEPGYAGVAVDYDTAKVTVSWKGETPPSVSALETVVPQGVTVDVEQTALSAADLHAASTRLLDRRRAAGGPDAVLAALPAADHAGLVVEVSRDSPAARTTGLARNLERAAGVPVQLKMVDDDGVRSTAASRRNDRAPWHAGGAIATRDGTDYCTTGFSVITPAGNERIVTAAHCTEGFGSVVRDGAGQRLGKVSSRALELDAELIRPAGDTAGSVFGGRWNASRASPRYGFPVAAVRAPAVGQRICSSGAVTGEHCGVKILATDVTWSCGKKTCHGFRASRDDGGVVVGGGDSGGPMYTVVDGQAHARGMIDGGSNRRSCGSTSVTTQCFSYVYGIPMVDILSRWNARIDN
jgi:hypothetical protein